MPRQLRIGYFLPPRAEGGIARHALALIDHIRERHEAIAFCDRTSEGFAKALGERDLAVRIIERYPTAKEGVLRPLFNSWAPMREARDALRTERLDVVHFHAGRLGALYPAILASRSARVPARLLTVHNAILLRPAPQRFFEARVLETLDRIVAVSAAVKNDLVEKKNVAPEKVAVIANGVDASEFDTPDSPADIRSELGITADALVVGAVARLHHDKGLDLLLRAVAELKPRWPALRVIIVGAGAEEQSLRQLAAAERVADVVHFIGYRADARRLMRAVDIMVVPSRREGQPFALIEAMAARKPVVAANVGGIPEAVTDGVTGLLFPPGDVAALADATERLLDDANVRAAMGDAARERVERDFSEAAMVRKTTALYEELSQASR
jgi:glycosyltransferase involved in cell wall biosynthesis